MIQILPPRHCATSTYFPGRTTGRQSPPNRPSKISVPVTIATLNPLPRPPASSPAVGKSATQGLTWLSNSQHHHPIIRPQALRLQTPLILHPQHPTHHIKTKLAMLTTPCEARTPSPFPPPGIQTTKPRLPAITTAAMFPTACLRHNPPTAMASPSPQAGNSAQETRLYPREVHLSHQVARLCHQV